MSRFLKVFALIAVTLAALPAAADDGATPIPFVDPYATPHIITAPGHYVATRNLGSTGPGPILIIECPAFGGDPVVVDVNGMLLDNRPNPADPVIRIVGDPRCDVVIRNGETLGGAFGIEVIPPMRKLHVEGMQIKETGGEGILAPGVHEFIIRKNAIMETGSIGLALIGTDPKSGVIEDNEFRRTKDGMRVEVASGLEISNNRLFEIDAGPNGGVGISVLETRSCLIAQNTLADIAAAAPVGNGIELLNRTHCKLWNNTVDRTSGEGIFIDNFSPDNLLLDNSVREAGRSGIRIDSPRNHIQKNITNFNGFIGLELNAAPNSVGRNFADSNGTAGPAFCGPVFPDYCEVGGSVSQGDNVFSGGPF